MHEQGGNYSSWQLGWHIAATDGSADRAQSIMEAGAVYCPPGMAMQALVPLHLLVGVTIGGPVCSL